MSLLTRTYSKVAREGPQGLIRAAMRSARIRMLGLRWAGAERYAAMQRAYYRDVDPHDDDYLKHVIIGNYEEHEQYPYERYLLHRIPDPSRVVALDFGCGPGRMIRRLAPLLSRVDGVDISPGLIEAARRWTRDLPNPPRLYVNDGACLSGIRSDEYDLVYCTIAFHHVACYDVRLGLMQEFTRVLKPSGHIALQMVYTDRPRAQWAKHADWYDNPYQATGTNSQCDVRITPTNLADVETTFRGVGLTDFSTELAPLPHPLPDATSWIFLHARKPALVVC